jgi:hypothetical protein
MGMLLGALVPLLLVHQSQVKLEFMPPVGKSYHYLMSMSMKMDMPASMKGASGAGSPFNMSMTMSIDMKAISRNGDLTTIETHAGAPKIDAPAGSPFAGAMKSQMAKGEKGESATIQIDRHFGMHNVTGKASSMSNAFGGMSFPTHALRIGDSWVTSVDLSKVMGAMGGGVGAPAGGKLNIKNRLTAIRQINGATIAMIATSTDTSMPIGAGGQSMTMHLTGQGSCSIDVATGMFQSMTMPMDMSMAAQGQTFNMHMNESMTRV